MDRRKFLKSLAVAGSAGIVGTQVAEAGVHHKEIKDSWMGCLVDLTLCIGCRMCEWACAKANNRDVKPLPSYEDQSVFKEMRRPKVQEYTVVNKYENKKKGLPTFVKVQCFHCNDPACMSACLVSAFSKQADGTVLYDPWRCMGCRYCLVACPFQIPAYEYGNPLTPEVRRCTFCHDKISKEGGVTACAEICPQEAIIYGPRKELIKIAHERIRKNPDKYVDSVYGEHEAGGTSWMYISDKPFEELDFPKLGTTPLPHYTESIQHGVFKYFFSPVALYGILGAIMYQFKPEKSAHSDEKSREEGRK